MMQQKATAAAPSPAAVSAFLSSSRHLVEQKVVNLAETFNQYVKEFKSKNNLSTSCNNKKHQKKTSLNVNEHEEIEIIVKKHFEPLYSLWSTNVSKNNKNNTFYENRNGFSADHDLFKHSEFNANYRNRGVLFDQQRRNFRTKRQVEQQTFDENEGNPFSLNNVVAKMQQKQQSGTDSSFRDVLNKMNAGNRGGGLLGSIFGKNNADSSSSSAPSTNTSISEQDKAKVAFVEGFLYRQAKEDKKNQKYWSPLKWFLIFFIVTMGALQLGLIGLIGGSVGGSGGKSGASGGGGSGINIRSLTGSQNYEVDPENVNVKFDDVKGLPEAKKELAEIVDFLKEPEKYTQLGARLPKGVLLVGPPGCGKTLLAKSVAGEAGVPFFQAAGSDFDEMFVGTGSKRVRQLFANARAQAPCVIFIDEIDSVGSTRTNSAIHPHANQTINQLLAEMDGFTKNEGVIVLGATNRRETLDSALMRPGRFDVEVRIDKPDFKARVEMLDFYLDKVARDADIDVEYLAKQLTGLGGSSIENVVNQAALRAVVTGHKTVKMESLEWALDRTLMGYGKSRLADEACNKLTAYHEAGHVLVAYFTKGAHPLHKVTILPRAQSLGHTSFVPEDDGYSMTKQQLLARMDVSMGGRVAEELIYGVENVTTGASSDFQGATNIATGMIRKMGMNDKIGYRVFEDSADESLSPQTQELLDTEIKKLLNESYERARSILKAHGHELKLIADHLMEHETLDVDQIKSLVEKNKMPPSSANHQTNKK